MRQNRRYAVIANQINQPVAGAIGKLLRKECSIRAQFVPSILIGLKSSFEKDICLCKPRHRALFRGFPAEARLSALRLPRHAFAKIRKRNGIAVIMRGANDFSAPCALSFAIILRLVSTSFEPSSIPGKMWQCVSVSPFKIVSVISRCGQNRLDFAA